MDDVITKYVEKFNESVPIHLIPASWSDEKLKKELERCIKENKPLEIETEENADY
ncbi:hypothetical protein [Bacillus licheniformis]|uniref:hypothetical protein n=1 Tax=Bacillus licheniformis TaxID=1402 RepID=UPI0012FAAB00|nr:hypothetical protein [Bacillus licheniformis]MED0689949.1 hypothetical protein [Bacillus licheniformis]MED0713593.1 hypothetical protein [Bacillus licheniformis]MED0789290.1 hypothetical protein [Bacillus licheniformis]TWM10461.1 hypothetical protein CHCC15091_0958 [Bacillus licheniformis]WIW99372.1 hypothetical protein QQ984_03570 [Bacillus licheniformis]